MTIPRHELYNLQNTSPLEERLLAEVLRMYGAVFSDFTRIHEGYLAERCGTDRHHIYVAFKTLARRGVWKYIPPKRTPVVSYPRQRVLSERLVFPPAAYSDLRNRFSERIKAMLDYAESEDRCRSEILLAYFGEKQTAECGCCDVCVSRKRKDDAERNAGRILALLADGDRHNIAELQTLRLGGDELGKALDYVVGRRKVTLDGAFVSINR